MRQISSECVHCVCCWWPKTTILSKFWHLGDSVPTPFYWWAQIWCARVDPQSTLTCQISSSNFVTLWRRKTPNFTILLTLAFCGITSWWRSEKVEHRCTTTNLSLSNGIKIISVLHRLHGEIRCTNSDIQKRDGQTNKKTQCFWSPQRRVKSKPHQFMQQQLQCQQVTTCSIITSNDCSPSCSAVYSNKTTHTAG